MELHRDTLPFIFLGIDSGLAPRLVPRESRLIPISPVPRPLLVEDDDDDMPDLEYAWPRAEWDDCEAEY